LVTIWPHVIKYFIVHRFYSDVLKQYQSDIGFLRSVCRLLVTANVPSSPIPVTMMMEALHFYETSILTRVTRRTIPEYGILQCDKTVWAKKQKRWEAFGEAKSHSTVKRK
jgi:hypothetical protein